MRAHLCYVGCMIHPNQCSLVTLTDRLGPPRPTLGSVFSSAHRLWLNEDALGEYKKLSSVPGYLGSDRRTFNSHKTFLDHPVSHLRSYSFR